MSALEETLLLHIRGAGLPEPAREIKFHPRRRWRFDLAWLDRLLACEVEGGTWAGGRHTRGSGFEQDAEKYNAAVLLGWRVLRVTGKMIEDGRALATLEEVLK